MTNVSSCAGATALFLLLAHVTAPVAWAESTIDGQALRAPDDVIPDNRPASRERVSSVPSADSAAIAALEQEIEDAIVRRDTVFLSSVFAPTFQWTHNGSADRREARSQFLSGIHREPSARVGRTVSRTADSVVVEVHGDIALTTGRIHVVRTAGEIFQEFTLRYVRMYRRGDPTGPWQLVSHRATALTSGRPLAGDDADSGATSRAGALGDVPRTLVVVAAHPDDEAPVAPILARYAREGAQVHLIIASDGGAGAGQQGNIPRPDVTVQRDELVRQRAQEARCAAEALGIRPPILLGFPDGKLGDYAGDRALIYRLTQRIAEELARLRPDAVVTWGPDGGLGHPDHRIVSNIVTQLQRAGAPGVPGHVFYMNLPIESLRAMNPERGEPPFTVPQAKYFTVRVLFTPEDLEAAERSMMCHQSQITPEAAQRLAPATARAWGGAVPLIPAFERAPGSDLFR